MIKEWPGDRPRPSPIDQGLRGVLEGVPEIFQGPSGNAAEKQRGATYAIRLTQSRCLRERGLEPLPNQVSRAIDSDKAEVSGSSPLRPTASSLVKPTFWTAESGVVLSRGNEKQQNWSLSDVSVVIRSGCVLLADVHLLCESECDHCFGLGRCRAAQVGVRRIVRLRVACGWR